MSLRHSKFKNQKKWHCSKLHLHIQSDHHMYDHYTPLCMWWYQHLWPLYTISATKKRKKSALRVKLPKWETHNYDVSEIVQFPRIIKKHTYNSKTCIFCFFWVDICVTFLYIWWYVCTYGVYGCVQSVVLYHIHVYIWSVYMHVLSHDVCIYGIYELI